MEIVIRNDKAEISGYVNAVARDSKPIRDEDGYFVEQMEPGVFARALTKRPNVEILLNHDSSRRLGCTGENLELKEDSIGLFARAIISDAEVIEKAKRGKLRGWSFAFLPLDMREEMTMNIPRRHVLELELYEVSIIDENRIPVYSGTSIEARADGEENKKIMLRMVDDELTVKEVEKIDYSPYEERLRALEV